MKKPQIIVVAVIAAVVLAGAWLGYRYLFARRKGHPPPPKVVVCIDPGHPSETNSGAIAQHGTAEVYINWVVALKLKQLLEQDGRIQVVLTRAKQDTFTRNRDRAHIANAAHASLAIHLHCDAGPSHGFTVYYPNKRGKSEGKKGPSRWVIIESWKAAVAVHQGLVHVVNRRDRGLKGESKTRIGQVNGGLTYSIWSEVPSVTVEMVFLSNRYDAAYIKSYSGQDQMARGLALGIETYLKPELRKYDRKYARWRARNNRGLWSTGDSRAPTSSRSQE
jgi:N-acetylmuramoyl-L-alanine amidase